jgi:phosphonoacetaldehyde hydrolase
VDHGSRAPVAALQAAFDSAGLVLTEAQARGPMGLGKRDHIAALLQDPAVREAWLAAHGLLPDDEATDRVYAAFASLLPDAVARHAQVIPGAVEVVARLRADGLRIGSTTGYSRSVAAEVARAAAAQGLGIDSLVATDDVSSGRPAPWMAFRALEALAVYPPAVAVKVGDTGVDMEEGRNAGAWCVGVSETGNEIGLDEATLSKLHPDERRVLAAAAAQRLVAAGAHEVVTSVAVLPEALARIEARLAARLQP